MKILLIMVAAVSTLLIGCGQQEDMSSPPVEAPAAADTNATTTTP